MGVLLLELENNLEQEFRKLVEQRLGRGEQNVKLAFNELLRVWIRRYG